MRGMRTAKRTRAPRECTGPIETRALRASSAWDTPSASHKMWRQGPILFCAVCGSWSESRVMNLARPCNNGASEAGRTALRRIETALHPGEPMHKRVRIGEVGAAARVADRAAISAHIRRTRTSILDDDGAPRSEVLSAHTLREAFHLVAPDVIDPTEMWAAAEAAARAAEPPSGSDSSSDDDLAMAGVELL